MADLEKVIDSVYNCIHCGCKQCTYYDNGCEKNSMLADVLELLKEYAVIKGTISNEIHETAKMFRRTEDNGWIEKCDRRARQSLSD